MATLEQVGEMVCTQLRERVDTLVSAVEDDVSDLADVARLADAVGELADTIGEIYGDLERMLARGLQGGGDSRGDGDASVDGQAAEPRGRRRQKSERTVPASEDVTKEELLERARDVYLDGRSSMSKDELAQAVEAEESVTKEELLERAREAGIEGRSAMTKDELRRALHDVGV
jgi:hypothetical protein